MDDIIIFSKTIEQHYKDLIVIINIFLNANMNISIEKSKFFKLETTFLGYVVPHNVIKTDPEKISTILKYPISKIQKIGSKLRKNCKTSDKIFDLPK